MSYFEQRIQRDRLLQGQPDGTFADITDRSGTNDPFPTMGISAGDYNRDGWVDLAVGNFDVGYQLYANSAALGEGNHRFVVELAGGDDVNLDAVGSRVTVETDDGLAQTAEVRAGTGIGAGDDLALQFGLGTADIERVTVRWPDGTEQFFDDVPRDVLWSLASGSEPETTPLADVEVPRAAAIAAPRESVESAGLVIPALTFLTTLGLVVHLVARRWYGGRLVSESLKLLVLWSVSFQVAHFGEHFIQMAYWAAFPSRPLYITPWGRDATEGYTQLADRGGQTTGTELLHLTGNWIFLAGLIAAFLAIRRMHIEGRGAVALQIACIAQGFHVFEHVMLTTTWFEFERSIGFSTLFGQSFHLGGVWAQSFRGWVHFILNLIPTVAAVTGVVMFDFARAVPAHVRARLVRGPAWALVDAVLVGVAAATPLVLHAAIFRDNELPDGLAPVALLAAVAWVAAGLVGGLYRRGQPAGLILLRDLVPPTVTLAVALVAVPLDAGIPLWAAVAAAAVAPALAGVARWVWTLQGAGPLFPAADDSPAITDEMPDDGSQPPIDDTPELEPALS